MMLSDSDRHELKLILMAVRDSDLRIIQPELVPMVQRAVDLLTTQGDIDRLDAMKARLAAIHHPVRG